MNADPVLEYIRDNWDRSVYRDDPGIGSHEADLPYPYTCPCMKGSGRFEIPFYWDTYFTNIGLLAHERFDVAKGNVRNMLWLLKRRGFVPNHVRIGARRRSQPPYLCRMVREYVEASGNEAFLAEAAEGLRQEYHFWMTARRSPVDLNRHGHHTTWEQLEAFYDQTLTKRLGFPPGIPVEEKRRIGGHYLAEGETGWDFTPRFEGRALHYCPVELNGLLYEYETYLERCSERLGWGEEELWRRRADVRLELVQRYLWNESRGLFLDYDFATGRPSPVASLGTFQPLAAGLATAGQADRVRGNLPLFERAHGLAVTEECPVDRAYQWGFPNMWPPLAYVAVEGLRRYGFEEDARRVAATYVEIAVRLFEKTGNLWEKIDANTGEVAGGEYEAAPMLGWSAGAFVALEEYLRGEETQ